MKVGPHSGMSLSEIVQSKLEEEDRLGFHFWGYSGSLCRPDLVLDFVNFSISKNGRPPLLILLETKSKFKNNIGKIKKFSTDQTIYTHFNQPVQLQGADFSFVAKELFSPREELDLSQFIVFNRNPTTEPIRLHKYLRYRVSKACAEFSPEGEGHISNNIRPFMIAKLEKPYVVWLKE